GILILSRFKNTLSPRTALEAQFFVDFGFLKSTGLKNIQSSDSKPGTKHHHPIHTLLQKLNTIMGSTEYLVQTLIGLECFIQFSSERLNRFAIFLSNVINHPHFLLLKKSQLLNSNVAGGYVLI